MKKIIIFGMLTTAMILTVSMVSAINTTNKNTQEEESPLYGIRTNRAISEKIQNLKTKFFGDRLFFLPIQLNSNNNQNLRDKLQNKITYDPRLDTCAALHTCIVTCDLDYCRIFQETFACGSCKEDIFCS